jgi:hypothetical protein
MRVRSRSITALVAASVLAACGGPSPGEPDASVPPDGGAPTTAPEPPLLSPCPPGWTPLERDGVATCEPTPSGASTTCTGATYRLPGATACVAIDEGCGSDPFPTIVVPDGASVAYVSAGATAGDGTRERPFGSITEALAADRVILVAAGTYEGTLDLPTGVVLAGVCAERVIVRASAGLPAIVSRAGTATIESLTVQGEHVGVQTNGATTLRGVAILGVRAAGIAAIGAGASLDTERTVIRDTRTEGGRLGRGVALELGASARLARVVIEGSHDGGLAATGGTIVLEDVAIRGTLPNDAGRFGSALAAFDGANLTIDRLAIEGASESGLLLDGVVARVRDVVVRDVASEASMENGSGIFVRAADVTIERAWIERASRAGLAVYAASDVHVSDVVVDATRASGVHAVGIGVVDSMVEVDRALVRDVLYAGVLAAGSATVVARDLVVRGVGISGDVGDGVLAGAGASLSLERFLLEGAAVVGAHAYGAGTVLTLASGRVDDVREGERFDFGRGVEIDVGARGELRDVAIARVRETGLVAYGTGTSVTLDRVSVGAIEERACAATTCSGQGGGSGIVAIFGASIVATALEVDGAPLCGVQVAEGGSLDVESGEIRGSAIGACVQVEGYDVARVVDGVAYRDNDVNLDTAGTFVPPPGPSDGVVF